MDDLAKAILFCLNRKINRSYLNVGSGEQITIKKLAKIIQYITKFKGKIFFNKKYPDGVKERKLDTSLLKKNGWKAKIKLRLGLKDYYNNFTISNK